MPNITSPTPVHHLLNPSSIAIIGMSSKPGSPGRTILDHLGRNAFLGDIHLVGRSGGTIDGVPVSTTIRDLPPGVDLALLTLPGDAIRQAVEDCVASGVKVAVIYASGFAELGDSGRDEQAAITRIAREGGLHLVGPNCIGFTNYVNPLNTLFLPDVPVTRLPDGAGPVVAILTQSGGLMGLIHEGLMARGIAVSYRITTGNEAGLTLADYLEYLRDDPATSGVVIYAEDVRDPQGFLQAVRAIRACGKTVTLMHSGRSARAQRAAASHTGALAADYRLMKTLVTRAGACVVESLEELLDVTELLARYPEPPRGGIAVATASGAYCAIALDVLSDVGLDVTELSPATLEHLTQRLPAYAPPSNPLDFSTAAAADPAIYHDGVAALLADDQIGAVSLALPFVHAQHNIEMLEQVARAAENQPKPVVLGMLGDVQPLSEELRSYAADHGIVLSMSPERGLRAIASLVLYGRALARDSAPAVALETDPLSTGPQPEWVGKRLLTDIGVSVPAGALVTSGEEAAAVAERVGYPVVAKAQSAGLLHKTESGGLVLDITDEAGVRAAFDDLTGRLPDLDGVLVEAMAAPGVELMVGAKRHPTWGPIIMVGLGGVWVEAIGDVRILPCDLPPGDIVDELRALRSAQLLGEFRGAPAVDLDAVAQVVAVIGQLMQSRPDIIELDINPLVARHDGATALDALVVVAQDSSASSSETRGAAS